jgi:hypothetical protein
MRTNITTTDPSGRDPVLCAEKVQVGRLTLFCELPNSDKGHTHGITGGPIHQAEHRNIGIRIVILWEGVP